MWDGLDPRDADGRERDASDPRDAEAIEPRDVFTWVMLPRARTRAGPRRTRPSAGSEVRTLATTRFFGAGGTILRDDGPAQTCMGFGALRHAGLTAGRTLERDGRIVSYPDGRRPRGAESSDPHGRLTQSFYAGRKPELSHDAQLYRAYLRAGERVAWRGRANPTGGSDYAQARLSNVFQERIAIDPIATPAIAIAEEVRRGAITNFR